VTVSVESRGSEGPVLLFEALAGNGALLDALRGSGVDVTDTSLGSALRGSALESAADASMPGYRPATVALGALGDRAWEDQSRDVRERVSERTLQHGGEQLLAVVRGLGGLDLQGDLEGPERTYLSLPSLGLVDYPASWNLLASAGLLLLWGLVGLVIRLRRGTRRGVLVGLGAGAATVGLSALAASTLTGLVGDLHPEHGLLHTALYREAPHVLALVAVALVVTSALYGAARTRCRFDEVLFGGLAVPLGYALWLTFTTPSAAAAVQWPLALALAGALLVTLLGPRRGRSAWTWGLLLLLSAAAVVLVVPDLQLVAGAWTLQSATALGALFGLTMLVLLPVMDWLQRPRVWATPLVGVTAAAVLVGLNLPAVQGAVDHPEPTTLVYLTDEAARVDPILRGGAVVADTASARTVVGRWLTVPGPGEEWARSWVGDPPTGSTDPGVLLLDTDAPYEVAGSAPDARIDPPAVTVVSSTPVGQRRDLVLEVRSGLRGEMLGVVVPDESGAELTGVGTSTWPVGGIPARSLTHWGVPEGGAVRVGLTVPSSAPTVELLVLEHHLRPREVLGDYFFQRADSIVPSGLTGSDRVIQRTRVTVTVPFELVPEASPLGGEQPAGGQEVLETPEQPVRD
jgi:hypothetical protein